VKLTIVAVGRLKERFWRDAAEEYLTRLKPYADVRVVEVADRDPAKGGEKRALAEEGDDVLKALPEAAHVIALTIDGTQRSSIGFAEALERLAVDGRSSLAFVIGGSHGLDERVLARAAESLSLGPMTLPHNLARIVFLEQLYRSFKIRRGEPYHK
jgi:23S rRNA (pseudouridine1915-N3)-methyltransferase